MTDVQLELVSNERALAQHAEAIRVLGKRAVRDIIEIGRRLTDAKELAGHGGWLPWLDREFGWKEQSARNFMQFYALSLKSPRLGDFNITFEGLYLLASPSAAEAREAIIKRAKDGERLTLAEVRRMIAEAKQAQAEENAERRAADLAKAEERLVKLRASFAEREKKIRKEHEGLLSLDEMQKEIERAVEPLKKKFERAQKELERLRRPKPRDDTRDDIGPNSASEAERLRARNEELERENHRLARENLALRSEIDELKAELARRAPADDGLDIPESLRRRTAAHG